MPQINFILAVGTLSLVVIFQSSNALAAAFGMAVNLVMIIVAILVMYVARLNWNWSIAKIIQVFSLFMVIDLSFLGANLHKIQEGAWIPLVFAFICAVIMLSWEKGMNILRSTFYRSKVTLPVLIEHLDRVKLNYLEDITTIFITEPYDRSGGSFFHYIKLTGIVPKQALIVSTAIENYPYISEKNRYELKKLGNGIYNLTLHFGFVQRIDLPRTLMLGDKMKILPFSMDTNKLIYLVEIKHISVIKKKYPHLFFWQKKLFAFLLRNSEQDIIFFGLPYNRTIAIGSYCEI